MRPASLFLVYSKERTNFPKVLLVRPIYTGEGQAYACWVFNMGAQELESSGTVS